MPNEGKRQEQNSSSVSCCHGLLQKYLQIVNCLEPFYHVRILYQNSVDSGTFSLYAIDPA